MCESYKGTYSTTEFQGDTPVGSWEEADRLLDGLEPSGPAFVIFTLSNGDYVQCAGSKDALVAEARLAASTSSPKHVRFGLGIRSGNKKTIHCNVGPIYVDETQVLRIEDAKAICREFIEHQGSLGTRFVAEDISDEQC